MIEARTDIIERVTGFCRLLRARGIRVTPAESIDAVRALSLVDLGDRLDLHFALRTLLTTRRDELSLFDALFAEWWDAPGLKDAKPKASDAARAARRESRPSSAAQENNAGSPALTRWAKAGEAVDDEAFAVVASPSTTASRARKDFAAFENTDLAELQRLTSMLARRLNARRSRRWKPASGGSGARADLRRTLRLSLKTGGDPLELARRERKLRRTKLVALCDVSGSMDLYSRFLIQFLYALQHSFARVETFAFSTRLVRITEALARDTYRTALDTLAQSETGWSGGTKIGGSIAEFVATWPRLVDRRTVVIILSDGWDTGEPEVLGEALRAIHRRAGRVVWLNPLLGSTSYQPLTRGMQAALSHVDVFAAAHNLASLEALGRHLAL